MTEVGRKANDFYFYAILKISTKFLPNMSLNWKGEENALEVVFMMRNWLENVMITWRFV